MPSPSWVSSIVTGNRAGAVNQLHGVTIPAGTNRYCLIAMAVDQPVPVYPGFNPPALDGNLMSYITSALTGAIDRNLVIWGLPISDTNGSLSTLSVTKVALNDAYGAKVFVLESVSPTGPISAITWVTAADSAAEQMLTSLSSSVGTNPTLQFWACFDDAQTYSSVGLGTEIGSRVTNTSPTGSDHDLNMISLFDVTNSRSTMSMLPNGSISRWRMVGLQVVYEASSGTTGGGGGSGSSAAWVTPLGMGSWATTFNPVSWAL